MICTLKGRLVLSYTSITPPTSGGAQSLGGRALVLSASASAGRRSDEGCDSSPPSHAVPPIAVVKEGTATENPSKPTPTPFPIHVTFSVTLSYKLRTWGIMTMVSFKQTIECPLNN